MLRLVSMSHGFGRPTLRAATVRVPRIARLSLVSSAEQLPFGTWMRQDLAAWHSAHTVVSVPCIRIRTLKVDPIKWLLISLLSASNGGDMIQS